MNKFLTNLLFFVAIISCAYYNGLDDQRAKLLSAVCFGTLALIAVLKNKQNYPMTNVFKYWFTWVAVAFLVNCTYGFMNPHTGLLFKFDQDIAIPLIAAYSGFYLFELPEDKKGWFILPLCVLAGVIAVYTVSVGLGGFIISEFSGSLELAKNQIGAAFVVFAIIAIVCALDKETKMLYRGLYGIFSVLNIYPALYFGCRTALLCYFICVLVLFFRVFRWKVIIVIPVIIAFLAVFGGESIQEMIYTSIVGRRDATDMNDLTSGRLSHANLSLDYFFSHPLFGFFGSGDSFNAMPPNAHIYILYRLTKWGIIGAIPYLLLYFSVFKIAFYGFKEKNLLIFSLFLLIFIESFSEYAPPFGPGSCFVPAFVFLGAYMRQSNYIQKL